MKVPHGVRPSQPLRPFSVAWRQVIGAAKRTQPRKRWQVRYSPTSTITLSVFLGAEATIPGLTPWPFIFVRILQIMESPPSKINLVLFLLSLNFLPQKTKITRQEK